MSESPRNSVPARVVGAPIASAPVQIAEQIRQLIMRGELTPGQTLPPDGELGELFGVGRGAVKRAIDALVESGLLLRPSPAARRFVVVDIDPETISDFLAVNLALVAGSRRGALHELLEVRRLVEVPAVKSAARRVTETMVADLRGSADAPSLDLTDRARLRRARRFHHAILRASGNEMLAVISEPVFAILAARFTPRPLDVGYWDRVRAEHDRILGAIEAGDPAAAGEAMAGHLETVASIYVAES